MTLLDLEHSPEPIGRVGVEHQGAKHLPHAHHHSAREIRALEMISAAHRVIMRATDEARLMSDVCEILVKIGGYKLAWVGYAKEDPAQSVQPVGISGSPLDYVLGINASWGDNERGRGPMGCAFRTGRHVVIRDFHADASLATWSKAARHAGLHAMISLPLVFAAKTPAVLNIYSSETKAFDRQEVKLLDEFAADIAYAMNVMRLRAANDEANQLTAQHHAMIASLIEVCPDGIALVGPDDKLAAYNNKLLNLWGTSEKAVSGKTIQQVIANLSKKTIDPDAFLASQSEALSSDRDRANHLYTTLKDGRFLEHFNAPARGKNGAYFGHALFIRDITKGKLFELKLKRFNRFLIGLIIGLLLLALVLVSWPHISKSITSPQGPNVLGSVAVKISNTPLATQWRQVAATPAPATPAITALLQQLRGRPQREKLELVNTWVNRELEMVPDLQNYGQPDYWATLSQSLLKRSGDCEDLAIAKMQILRAAGFPSDSIYLVLANDLVRRADHAILMVRLDGEFLALDSSTNKILTDGQIQDYRPILTFNGENNWTHGVRKPSSEVALGGSR